MKTALILEVPNDLHAKLGDALSDAAMLERVEEALHTLSAQFKGWLSDDIIRLNRAVKAACQTPGEASRRELLRHYGDLKGMGTTYGYPLVSRVAASACLLLTANSDLPLTLPLLEAHAAAITVLVDCEIRDESHAEGQRLAHELEVQVQPFHSRVVRL
ncbi:MAG: Hpt domain-containing protein [Asticcacaulis sp.]|uniref:Hpt domain-containing protein n=1 Tax=Asticcacaulis sp. TaxID=1872648 RepID=UPI0025C3FF9F|nr:Hpt domain-containing protein [Asticcacaulis sp.]MCA1934906.1 Hpt domain-containing protein [Asticcacaulis sp.]